ncbi:MAG: hypothetical protein ACRERR_09300 [Moraxellaceae bacterium]
MTLRILATFVLTSLLAACTGDGDTEVTRATVATETPNAFLLYPNTQASLGAGSYEVEVETVSGAAGTYSLLAVLDDGSSVTRSGSIAAGGSKTETGIALTNAGGLTLTATSSVPVRLTLRRAGDTNIIKTAVGSISLPLSQISSAAYGEAYYDAVDPNAERTTLADWKSKNGFNAGFDSHVIFRDAKDLGYGRDMYARRNADGTLAFFVNNYVVVQQPGSSSNYGPLNVEAAIAQDQRYLLGTNAIEFTPANQDGASDNGSIKITKFFTFNKSGNRIASADLDGRGVKHMPGMCWACHGGQTLPLDESGKFQAISLRSAKFNLVDAGILEYSPQSAYQRPQLEMGLRTLNQFVHESFETMDSERADTQQGKWSADAAIALAEGRYGSSMNAAASDDDFVPEGWKESDPLNFPARPLRPVGVELLFKKVVEPHCLGCHSLQGSVEGELIMVPVNTKPVSLANAINFASYEKFISYRERIADYVYHRGIMPMSLRNYESFWSDPEGAPTRLASFLSDPALSDLGLFGSNGKVIEPGLPVARPGADRLVKSLPSQMDGNASLFATSWRWVLKSQPAQAPGNSVSLLNAQSARATVVVVGAAANGDYVFELTVSNAKGTSTTVSSTLTVDSALPKAPEKLTFAADIAPILNNNPAVAQQCTSCHSAAGTHPGVPVYWNNSNELYRHVMERVSLKYPENSRLLTKPTSLNHGGAIRIDLNTAAGRKDYSTIVNWIREGAVCGTDATLCP